MWRFSCTDPHLCLRNDRHFQASTHSICSSTDNWTVQTLGVFSKLEANWAEPTPSILKMVSLSTFDLEAIRIQCAFKKDDPVLNFIASLMVFPCFVAAVGIMILLAKTVGKNMQFFFDPFLNVVGLLCLVFYISVAISVLRPLHCVTNPDGTSSLASNSCVVCCYSPTHIFLVSLASIGVLVYLVAILAVIAHITLFCVPLVLD